VERDRIYLLPGDYQVVQTPCELATLLGSCVGVCLRHIDRPYAAMNHFLLARARPEDTEIGRYGDRSTTTIIRLMQQLDATEAVLRARIFGGGRVIEALVPNSDIGAANIAVAREVLAAHRIPIEAEDVGGTHGRRIRFDTASGRVMVQRIQSATEFIASRG
jgi:chemotaxis protein CheD